jgi:hypothetical protein
MAIFQKYNAFIDALCSGGHNLKTAAYKVALTNTAPNAAVDTTFSAPPPAAANGYPSGGASPTVTSAATSGGVFTLKLQDTVFIASSGGIGPFRYVIVYNSTTSGLIGFYDYGSSLTLNATDTFTTDFDDANGVLTVQ